MNSNPCAMRMIQKDTIFTNTGYTQEGEVYWEGMGEAPKGLMTWKHKLYDGTEKAAHPNSRFTTPIENCDRLDPAYKDPFGVKLDAILFGGRREEAVPLVVESLDFAHGVFMGASLSSETTSASAGKLGIVRQDPFAMLPFCGYNMGLYFNHWLDLGKKSHPPLIFGVNWFRKNEKGGYVWPGFSENMRIIKWIFERCDHKHQGKETPLGLVPLSSELDLKGLDVNFESLFAVSSDLQIQETARLSEFFKMFGNDLPSDFKKFIKL